MSTNRFFGVKILKQMPYKSKSRKRRVDKMPTDGSNNGTGNTGATSGGNTTTTGAGIPMDNVVVRVNSHSKLATTGSGTNSTTHSGSPSPTVMDAKPIPFREFDHYYRLRRADSGLKLAEEYEELKDWMTARNRTTKISQFTINKPKNRFVNILPYDHTIVKLGFKGDSVGSDYINANFISGFHSDEEYIACQAPLHSTVNDFFRMVIEHNVMIVVTLTQCIEKGRSKCEKYWPSYDDIDENDMVRPGGADTDSGTGGHKESPVLTFGDITVELVSERMEGEFIIRELKLIKGDSHHSLTQYHYIQWPDFGCPQNPYSLIHLIEIIRKQYKTLLSLSSMAAKKKMTHNKTTASDREVVVGEDVAADNGLVEGEGVVVRSPILVHCSAGVGRSGTFIAVDRIMEMLKHSPDGGGGVQVPKDLTIDVFNTVCDMRRCRPNMVQTEDQYIYIYDCIKYFIDRLEGQTAGPTDVTDTSLCDIIEKEFDDKSSVSSSIDKCDEQNSGLNSHTNIVITIDNNNTNNITDNNNSNANNNINAITDRNRNNSSNSLNKVNDDHGHNDGDRGRSGGNDHHMSVHNTGAHIARQISNDSTENTML